MSRMNIAILVIALLAMVGAGTGIGLAASASASAHTSATVSADEHLRYVLFDCNSGPQVRPAGYIATCADDGVGLGQSHWTSWPLPIS